MRRIQILRAMQRLSQWQLSHEIGISSGRYSMIERGLVKPTVKERQRLAEVLGAPPATLFRSAIRSRAAIT